MLALVALRTLVPFVPLVALEFVLALEAYLVEIIAMVLVLVAIVLVPIVLVLAAIMLVRMAIVLVLVLVFGAIVSRVTIVSVVTVFCRGRKRQNNQQRRQQCG